MEFDAFGFFISIINFGVMFALFYPIVIGPMEEAVEVRQKRVEQRLDDIRQTLAEAKRLEAETETLIGNLEAEKQEMSRATEEEIARVQQQLSSTAERDAEHLVAKTRRECEKNRQDTLAYLNQQLANLAMSKVEAVLSGAFDSQAQAASAQSVLGRVVKRAS